MAARGALVKFRRRPQQRLPLAASPHYLGGHDVLGRLDGGTPEEVREIVRDRAAAMQEFHVAPERPAAMVTVVLTDREARSLARCSVLVRTELRRELFADADPATPLVTAHSKVVHAMERAGVDNELEGWV